MDKLQAVHLVLWLWTHRRHRLPSGPPMGKCRKFGNDHLIEQHRAGSPVRPRSGAHRCPYGVLVACACATVRTLSTVTSPVPTPVTTRCKRSSEVDRIGLPFFLQTLNLQTEDPAFRPAATGDSAQSPP